MIRLLRLHLLTFALCCFPLACFAQSKSTSPNLAPAPSPSATQTVTIPGPLHSFLRMSGISQKAAQQDILPLLGHFVEIYGYEGWNENSTKPTEALNIVKRYVDQSRALQLMAGVEGSLRFDTCEGSKPLLTALGYRLKAGCQSTPEIEVSDPDRSFLTLDSGFPLVDLQDALREGKPFRYPYASSTVPVIWTTSEWVSAAKPTKNGDLLDALLGDPVLARLYFAIAAVDAETRDQVYRPLGVQKLLPLAPVLDFYGAEIYVRNGRIAVPGGAPAEAGWKKLVGAEPTSPSAFASHLLAADKGHMVQFYDSIARAGAPQQAYFTDGARLERMYRAFRGDDSSDDAVKAIFRPGGDLLLLTTRLPLDPDGSPHVPGNAAIWKETFRQKPATKVAKEWAKKASGWNSNEDFIEGLMGFSRGVDPRGPVQTYLILSAIDRSRPQSERLGVDTAKLLATHAAKMRDQYQVFVEFSALNDASMSRFVRLADRTATIQDSLVRGDTMGILEANIGLWEILVRQGEISQDDLNGSWQRVLDPFGNVNNSEQLFEAAEKSLAALMKDASGSPVVSEDKLIRLLAGPPQNNPDGSQARDRAALRIRTVLTDQRLVSLDTLQELAELLQKRVATPEGIDLAVATGLAKELEETRAPRAMFTESERAQFAPGHWQNHHILAEMKTDVGKSLTQPPNAGQTAYIRGELAPFLRDTLVGLNYAYYEPPGGDILHNSPMLVRSHDFLASEALGDSRAWAAPEIFGVGVTAGNGAHLSGSLAGLPYVLCSVEQDFIVPSNVQALIWHETAAELLTSAVSTRWWSSTTDELHAATLYQKTGEELISESANDADVRGRVVDILYERLGPSTMQTIQSALAAHDAPAVLATITPADTFYLAVQYRKAFPGKMSGTSGAELDALGQRDSALTGPTQIAAAFGVPHPVLAQSYANEMLGMKPLPSVMGYASELLAESWESTNLYWARLADEMGYSPVMMNQIVPILTRRMVEKIFASDFDDWDALVRAMHETGDEFRRGELAGIPKAAAVRP
jgi:hypothetical protein